MPEWPLLLGSLQRLLESRAAEPLLFSTTSAPRPLSLTIRRRMQSDEAESPAPFEHHFASPGNGAGGEKNGEHGRFAETVVAADTTAGDGNDGVTLPVRGGDPDRRASA
eukprot:CAMPEP_0114532684 /NCGR_PEP_ID=MMETSP0109-20121206/26810_1 /TAXON_ID=29199 /ORGANISM="Chlorarachnion reptans, Strain CCCM449" /LENGTH=108 /DNA_ID=CAMNT_0001715791 /DNA_START=650 /DNA_END=973 /DNA_ORIENTATION=-